jgi:hypothetical protein
MSIILTMLIWSVGIYILDRWRHPRPSHPAALPPQERSDCAPLPVPPAPEPSTAWTWDMPADRWYAADDPTLPTHVRAALMALEAADGA